MRTGTANGTMYVVLLLGITLASIVPIGCGKRDKDQSDRESTEMAKPQSKAPNEESGKAANEEEIEDIGNLPKEISLDLGNNVSIRCVLIPGGKFLMGLADDAEAGIKGRQKSVIIRRPFYMAVTEVSQGQYETIMGVNPSQFKAPENPVENVSSKDASAFCQKLSQKTVKKVRLPTEAEWEYACRAGSDGHFSFGNDQSLLGDYAWFKNNSESRTHPIGQKKPNAWGLYDMHGNVAEWCADWQPYPAREDGMMVISSGLVMMRGGNWKLGAWLSGCAVPGKASPDICESTLGFRIAVDAR